MTNPNPEHQRRADPLEYAGGLPRGDSDSSRLLAISLVLAVISCPFCLVSVLHPINRMLNDLTYTYVAGARNNGDRMGAWVPLVLFGFMGIATLLPIVAIVKSLRSKQGRGGIIVAAIALAVALLWWPLLYMIGRAAAAFGGRH